MIKKEIDFSALLPRLKKVVPLLILILAPLPLFFLLLTTNAKLKKINTLENKITFLHQKFILAKLQKEKENIFLNKLEQATPFFVDHNLETLVFLKEEQEKEGFSLPPGRPNLRFVEGKIRKKQGLQEVEEKQETAVLMNTFDLKQVLSLVENVNISPFQVKSGSPQLLFRSLDLKKIAITHEDTLFEVNMQLIKREKVQ